MIKEARGREAKERLLSTLPLAMSKSKVASKKVISAPPLRKVHLPLLKHSALVLTIF